MYYLTSMDSLPVYRDLKVQKFLFIRIKVDLFRMVIVIVNVKYSILCYFVFH